MPESFSNHKKRHVNLVVIHCSATREDVDYTFEQCRDDHRKRGFSTVGYHFFIRKDGTIHIGRDMIFVGAHVKDWNLRSVGICYEGGLDKDGKPKDTRTPAQKEAIIECIKRAIEYSGGLVKRICGHRDLSPDKDGDGIVEPDEYIKWCPSFNADPEYSHLLKKPV